MLNFRRIATLFLILAALGCKSDGDGPKPVYLGSGSQNNGGTGGQQIDDNLAGTDFNILFVGNSLTYTNNLPQLVKDKGDEKGLNIGIKMVALSNHAISDHWATGVVQDFISSQQFHYVVIQQGPSSQALGRQILIDYGKLYSELCEANGAQLAFFMVWPSLMYYHTFDGVIANYTEAAELYNSILCPAGRVWKEHFDSTNDFSYYGTDGFHPSLIGSEIAADVILESILKSEEEEEVTKGG